MGAERKPEQFKYALGNLLLQLAHRGAVLQNQ